MIIVCKNAKTVLNQKHEEHSQIKDIKGKSNSKEKFSNKKFESEMQGLLQAKTLGQLFRIILKKCWRSYYLIVLLGLVGAGVILFTYVKSNSYEANLKVAAGKVFNHSNVISNILVISACMAAKVIILYLIAALVLQRLYEKFGLEIRLFLFSVLSKCKISNKSEDTVIAEVQSICKYTSNALQSVVIFLPLFISLVIHFIGLIKSTIELNQGKKNRLPTLLPLKKYKWFCIPSWVYVPLATLLWLIVSLCVGMLGVKVTDKLQQKCNYCFAVTTKLWYESVSLKGIISSFDMSKVMNKRFDESVNNELRSESGYFDVFYLLILLVAIITIGFQIFVRYMIVQTSVAAINPHKDFCSTTKLFDLIEDRLHKCNRKDGLRFRKSFIDFLFRIKWQDIKDDQNNKNDFESITVIKDSDKDYSPTFNPTIDKLHIVFSKPLGGANVDEENKQEENVKKIVGEWFKNPRDKREKVYYKFLTLLFSSYTDVENIENQNLFSGLDKILYKEQVDANNKESSEKVHDTMKSQSMLTANDLEDLKTFCQEFFLSIKEDENLSPINRIEIPENFNEIKSKQYNKKAISPSSTKMEKEVVIENLYFYFLCFGVFNEKTDYKGAFETVMDRIRKAFEASLMHHSEFVGNVLTLGVNIPMLLVSISMLRELLQSYLGRAQDKDTEYKGYRIVRINIQNATILSSKVQISDLTLEAGKNYIIIGGSGSGKTSLLGLICGGGEINKDYTGSIQITLEKVLVNIAQYIKTLRSREKRSNYSIETIKEFSNFLNQLLECLSEFTDEESISYKQYLSEIIKQVEEINNGKKFSFLIQQMSDDSRMMQISVLQNQHPNSFVKVKKEELTNIGSKTMQRCMIYTGYCAGFKEETAFSNIYTPNIQYCPSPSKRGTFFFQATEMAKFPEKSYWTNFQNLSAGLKGRCEISRLFLHLLCYKDQVQKLDKGKGKNILPLSGCIFDESFAHLSPSMIHIIFGKYLKYLKVMERRRRPNSQVMTLVVDHSFMVLSECLKFLENQIATFKGLTDGEEKLQQKYCNIIFLSDKRAIGGTFNKMLNNKVFAHFIKQNSDILDKINK